MPELSTSKPEHFCIRHRVCGFTLVELLIVIAILSILAGLLLPTLKSAVNKAREIACLNNLKQQSLVYINYANDWRDYFPYNYRPGTPHPTSSYGYAKFLNTIYPSYIEEPGIFFCPGKELPPVRTPEHDFFINAPGNSYLNYFYFAWNQYGNAVYESPYRLSRRGVYSTIICTDMYSAATDTGNHGSPAKLGTLYQDGHVKFRPGPDAWLKDTKE